MIKWLNNQRGEATLAIIGIGMIWGVLATLVFQQLHK